MRSRPTTKVVLDTRKKTKDGKHPLYLRYSYQRKRNYISLAKDNVTIGVRETLNFTPEEWEIIWRSRKSGKYKKVFRHILEVEQRAFDIVAKMKSYTFQEFKNKFLGTSEYTFMHLMDEKIKDMNVKTSSMYKSAKSNIISRRGHVTYNDLTSTFFNKLEHEMLQDGLSPNTVSMYFRCYRAVLNQAIKLGEVDRIDYPFGRSNYVIPSQVGNKKALEKKQILKLWKYEPQNFQEEYYKNLWFFSYLANGMNIKDIINLKYADIKGDYISFIRSKTRNTKKSNVKPVKFYISSEIAGIIDFFNSRYGSDREYIFPELTPGLSDEEKEKIRYNLVRQINKYMNRIGEKVGIEDKITTYVARHSFATILEKEGVRRKVISDALDHASINTTEIYLDSMNNDELIDISRKLL